MRYVTNTAELLEAMDAADEGETVALAPGTFVLSSPLEFEKSLTLQGANFGTPGDGTRRGPETRFEWSSPSLARFAPDVDVTFDGLLFAGSTLFDSGTSAEGTLVVANCRLDLTAPVSRSAITLAGIGHLVFADNEVRTVAGAGSIVHLSGGHDGSDEDHDNRLTLTGNRFIVDGEGIRPVAVEVAGVHGVIARNTFDSVDVGVLVTGSCGNLGIEANEFRDISRGAMENARGSYAAGVVFFSPSYTGAIRVARNRFRDVDAGVRASGCGSLTGLPLLISDNTFQSVLHIVCNGAMSGALVARRSMIDGIALPLVVATDPRSAPAEQPVSEQPAETPEQTIGDHEDTIVFDPLSITLEGEALDQFFSSQDEAAALGPPLARARTPVDDLPVQHDISWQAA